MQKYKLRFGFTHNDTRMLFASNELECIALSVIAACEEQNRDLVQMTAEDTSELRELFTKHLAHQKFSLVAMRDVLDGPDTEVHLVYKRSGWTMGPCAENNWGRDV